MKIITWNVYFGNRRFPKLLKHALSFMPDVLCLQEVPDRFLPHLENLPGYTLTSCVDFERKRNRGNGMLCTLTKKKPLHISTVRYFTKPPYSILSRFYDKVVRARERHQAILVTIPGNGTAYTVINARLSCAVNTRDRLLQLKTIMKNVPAGTEAILCGDLNIPDSTMFQHATGWIRGFKRPDYLIHERDAFEKLFVTFHLNNIFRGKSTTMLPKILLQLDHILVPQKAHIREFHVSRKWFGSDHRFLYAEISL